MKRLPNAPLPKPSHLPVGISALSYIHKRTWCCIRQIQLQNPDWQKANEITYDSTSDWTQEDRKAGGSAGTLHSWKPPFHIKPQTRNLMEAIEHYSPQITSYSCKLATDRENTTVMPPWTIKKTGRSKQTKETTHNAPYRLDRKYQWNIPHLSTEVLTA